MEDRLEDNVYPMTMIQDETIGLGVTTEDLKMDIARQRAMIEGQIARKDVTGPMTQDMSTATDDLVTTTEDPSAVIVDRGTALAEDPSTWTVDRGSTAEDLSAVIVGPGTVPTITGEGAAAKSMTGWIADPPLVA